MVIDDIIKKCIEIPGISKHRRFTRRTDSEKTADGKGSITFFLYFRDLPFPISLSILPPGLLPNYHPMEIQMKKDLCF